MSVPRHRPLIVLMAAILGLSAVLGAGASAPVLADPLPVLVSVTTDTQNQAIVTWQKQAWQSSVSVWWSSADGSVAAPYATWNDRYGLPLVDCWGGDQNGASVADGPDGTFLYGQHCQGQDVGDSETQTTTRVVLTPGTYYFQVRVFGENEDTGVSCNQTGNCTHTHYSGVYRLTVQPLNGGAPAATSTGRQPPTVPTLCANQAGETCPPGANPRPQEVGGPETQQLPNGGGQLDVAAGARATMNPPFNVDVAFGEIHFSEDLATFHCPSWTQPYPPLTTMTSWIGVRCRTVTTPQAAVLVEGTDIEVAVSEGETRLYVFAGRVEVLPVDALLADSPAVVSVGPGQMTTIDEGGDPAAPVAFDASTVQRWWDQPSDAAVAVVIALGVTGFMVLYFLPAILAVVLRRRAARTIGLLNLLAGWTVVGWLASLYLVWALRQPRYPPYWNLPHPWG